MPEKDHGPTIKDPEQYERLREEGMGKEKAARIANTPREQAGKKGGSRRSTRSGRRRISTARPERSGSRVAPA